MKALIGKTRKGIDYLLDLYSGKDFWGKLWLSVFFVLGFLWPLAGTAMFIFSRLRRKYQDWGLLALLGSILNIIAYFIQILVKLSRAG